MAKIILSSSDWQVRPKAAARGEAAVASTTLAGLPPEFLTDGSKVDDEVVVQPRPAARGADAPPAPVAPTSTAATQDDCATKNANAGNQAAGQAQRQTTR